MSNPTFFMVYNPAGRAPTWKHPTFDEAKREAERLAGLNPRDEFFILKSMGYCKKVEVSYTPTTENEELPF